MVQKGEKNKKHKKIKHFYNDIEAKRNKFTVDIMSKYDDFAVARTF